MVFFFFQAEDGIRDYDVTGVQTCALPIYGSQFYISLNDEKKFKGGDKHEAVAEVPETIWRSPGHNQEWFDMMKGGRASYSNFDIAAYLTEIILLGCISMRIGKKKMEIGRAHV